MLHFGIEGHGLCGMRRNVHWHGLKRTFLDFTPFLEMPLYSLLCLLASSDLLDPPNIQGPVLPRESPNATHIVAIIRELFTCETVF